MLPTGELPGTYALLTALALKISDGTDRQTPDTLYVQQMIGYKVALLTLKVRSTSTPSYLRLLIQDREHGRDLRSTTAALCQPFTTTAFA